MDSTRFITTQRGLAFLLVLLIADVPATAQQKPGTAVEKMASAIERALKAVTGAEEARPARPVRPAMPAAGFRPAQEAVARPAKDVDARLKRLQSHAAVMQEWFDLQAELTEPQQRELAKALEASISDLQKSWKAGDAQDRQRVFDDFFPIVFTDLTGPALYLEGAGTEAVKDKVALPEKQANQLSEALAEREEFYRAAALGYVLNLLDEYFFFTPEQREKMAEIVSKKVDLNAACYSMQTQAQKNRYFRYFNETSVNGMVFPLEPSGTLSDNQQVLADELTGASSAVSGNSEYIALSTSADPETMEQTLTDVGNTQRTRLQQNLAVRIDFYQSTDDLTERDVRRLTLAGKGAMDAVIREWKAKTRQSFERYREQFAGRNVSISLGPPQISQLLANELWMHTVKTVLPENPKAIANRDRMLRAARAKFVVAMLDRELWLEPFQRQRLLESVEELLPFDDVVRSRHQQNIEELTLLCIPLFKLSKLELTILSPSQRMAWNGMKGLFTENNGYVRVQTKRNGTLTIPLPK